jgi:hypothetical protein
LTMTAPRCPRGGRPTARRARPAACSTTELPETKKGGAAARQRATSTAGVRLLFRARGRRRRQTGSGKTRTAPTAAQRTARAGHRRRRLGAEEGVLGGSRSAPERQRAAGCARSHTHTHRARPPHASAPLPPQAAADRGGERRRAARREEQRRRPPSAAALLRVRACVDALSGRLRDDGR